MSNAAFMIIIASLPPNLERDLLESGKDVPTWADAKAAAIIAATEVEAPEDLEAQIDLSEEIGDHLRGVSLYGDLIAERL